MENPKCKKCGHIMVLKTKGKRKFYACSQYPKGCAGSFQPYKGQTEKIIRPDTVEKSSFPLTAQQLRIHDEFENGYGNLMINATAGSGKSSTSILGTQYFPEHFVVGFISFAKDITEENMKKTPQHIHCSTFNSLGGQNVRSKLKTKFKDDKLYVLFNHLVEEAYPDNKDKEIVKDLKNNAPTAVKIVEHLKNYMLQPTDESIDWICNKHNLEIDAEGDCDQILRYAIEALFEESITTTEIHDFSDQIYWCAVDKVDINENEMFSIPCKKFDILIVDEGQDTNRAQVEMIKRSLKKTGRLIIVGDKFQSIMGFRGADTFAMENIRYEFGCKELPLTISFRCSKAVGKAVNREFPHIEFSVLENAPEGIEEWIKQSQLENMVKPGNFVLCRNNAPLVKPCFSLLKKGIKAVILGRNIGEDLTGIISRVEKKYYCESIYDLLEGLEDYRDNQTMKLIARKMEMAVEALNDKIDTIIAISENADTIQELIQKINDLFVENSVEAVQFSSIHKSKGKESDTVFIIKEELMPSPRALTDEEIQQEENVKFVAYTRAKKNLYHVTTEVTTED